MQRHDQFYCRSTLDVARNCPGGPNSSSNALGIQSRPIRPQCRSSRTVTEFVSELLCRDEQPVPHVEAGTRGSSTSRGDSCLERTGRTRSESCRGRSTKRSGNHRVGKCSTGHSNQSPVCRWCDWVRIAKCSFRRAASTGDFRCAQSPASETDLSNAPASAACSCVARHEPSHVPIDRFDRFDRFDAPAAGQPSPLRERCPPKGIRPCHDGDQTPLFNAVS